MGDVPGFGQNARILSNLDYKVLAGDVWLLAGTALGVADAATQEVLVRVGDQSLVVTIKLEVTGKTVVDMLEGVTVTVSGNTLTAVNRNRVKAANHAITSTFFDQPTYTGGTSLLPQQIVLPGGEGSKSVGGEFEGGQSWVFKPNTDYILSFLNASGAAADLSAILQLYEEKISDG